MKISKLKIKNLFGITEFEADGKSIELLGANGTGKTSVLDAIRLALTNKTDREFTVKNGETEGEILIEFDNGIAIQEQVFAVGDGTSIQFQLVRSLPDWNEPVRGIVEAPHVFIDGVETTDFRYTTTGLIIFDEAPAAGSVLSWSGPYYFRVRFEDEELELLREWNGLWSGDINLITVK